MQMLLLAQTPTVVAHPGTNRRTNQRLCGADAIPVLVPGRRALEVQVLYRAVHRLQSTAESDVAGPLPPSTAAAAAVPPLVIRVTNVAPRATRADVVHFLTRVAPGGDGFAASVVRRSIRSVRPHGRGVWSIDVVPTSEAVWLQLVDRIHHSYAWAADGVCVLECYRFTPHPPPDFVPVLQDKSFLRHAMTAGFFVAV